MYTEGLRPKVKSRMFDKMGVISHIKVVCVGRLFWRNSYESDMISNNFAVANYL